MRNVPFDYVAEPAIKDAAIERLASRTGEGKPLDFFPDADRINRTEYRNRRIEMPLCWVADGETTAIDGKGGWYEDQRSMEILMEVQYRDLDPAIGQDYAREMALKTGNQLTKDDDGDDEVSLGLPYVTDISFRRSLKGFVVADNVYSHVAVYVVKYRARR